MGRWVSAEVGKCYIKVIVGKSAQINYDTTYSLTSLTSLTSFTSLTSLTYSLINITSYKKIIIVLEYKKRGYKYEQKN